MHEGGDDAPRMGPPDGKRAASALSRILAISIIIDINVRPTAVPLAESPRSGRMIDFRTPASISTNVHTARSKRSPYMYTQAGKFPAWERPLTGRRGLLTQFDLARIARPRTGVDWRSTER